jgi:hypothetical protein
MLLYRTIDAGHLPLPGYGGNSACEARASSRGRLYLAGPRPTRSGTWARTRDILFNGEALCQLSYTGLLEPPPGYVPGTHCPPRDGTRSLRGRGPGGGGGIRTHVPRVMSPDWDLTPATPRRTTSITPASLPQRDSNSRPRLERAVT